MTRLNIDSNANRVGVISYGSTVENSFFLSQYNNVNDLRNGILNVRYLGGNTNTAEAFRQARTSQFVTSVSCI